MAKSVGSVTVIEDNTREIITKFEAATDAALEAIGQQAENYAKRLCPVDTGNLRNSITHRVQGKEVVIGTKVKYGKYVELGTSRAKAQEFLRPAARDHSAEYRKILMSELS